jgi:hypothetical protein
MSGDIEQRLRTELQRLLDENPDLEPAQFIEGNQIVTVAVSDGIPQIAKSNFCGAAQYGCPHVTELHEAPAYHIYNLMQTLHCLDEERLEQGAAHILTLTPVEESHGARLESPQLPSSLEIVNSTLDDAAGLRTKPGSYGMFRHLETLQQKYQQVLAKHPELDALDLQTAKGAVEIRVTDQRLFISPSQSQGQPYMQAHRTPQVRMYLLHRTIQGLETALYGQAQPIEVARSIHRNKAEANLIRHLQQVQCGEVIVSIRRSRKNLYISGKTREITYLPLRIRITEQGLCTDEQVQNEPSGYARMQYGALPADLKQLLNAFFAYLSSRMSNGSCKH